MKQTVNAIFTGLLVAGLLLATPAHAEDIYKWLNENNQVQYTQMPPPHGIKAIRIQRSAIPDEADIEEDTPDEAEYVPETDAEDTAEAPGDDGEADDEGAAERDAEIAKAMQENCNNARQNLKSLNKGQVRYINPEGEVIRLTEEERQERIAEANAQIKLLCK